MNVEGGRGGGGRVSDVKGEKQGEKGGAARGRGITYYEG